MSDFTHHFSCKLNSLCRLFSKVVSVDHHHHQGCNIEDDWEYIEGLDRELELKLELDDDASIDDQDVVMFDHGESEFFCSPSLEQPNNNKIKYTILNKAEVRQRLEDKITKVCNVFLLPRNEAAILLQHFKWSVSRTNDEWLAREEKVRKAVGLFVRPVAEIPSDAAAIACSICHADFPRDFMFSVSCGHQICGSCWKCYIRNAINNEDPRCLTLRCPKPSCDAAVGFHLIELLSSEDDKKNFENHLLRTYIAHRRKAKWCPAPDCKYVVFSSNGGEGNVTCRCSHSFCWSCSGEGHAPVDCNTLAEWMSESNRQSENWVLANTISCPKCKFKFEQESCSSTYAECTFCNFEFCSECGDDWYNPEDKCHFCSRDALLQVNAPKELAKNSLERYNCYYNEWAICESSRAIALADINMFQDLQRELLCDIFGLSSKDLNFLVEALQQVAECWQLLKWMHVYGYFLADYEHVKKHLFEFMQEEAIGLVKRLHKHVEEIQNFLYCEVPFAQFVEYRNNITMLTRVTRNYIDQLVEGLKSGLSEVVCISEISPRLKMWRERGENSCSRKSPSSSLTVS